MKLSKSAKIVATIALEQMEFYAYHGVYEAERQIGNKYVVDVRIRAQVDEAAKQDQLSGTVDYGQVYGVIKEIMNKPTQLLEHLAYSACAQLLEKLPQILDVEVKVSKLNPPIGGLCAASSVTIYESR
jgi:7,8-dihydroneopterin aldolase/epimerase/oxygenase